MRRLFLVLFLLICAAYTTFAQSSTSADAKESFSPAERKFAFTYSFTLKNLPAGAKLVRIWIPVPPNDKHQSAAMTRIDAPVGSRLGKDAEYGNRIRYFEIAQSRRSASTNSRSCTTSRAMSSLVETSRSWSAKTHRPALCPLR